MDKLVSPYIDTEQYAKISLHPYQMTNDVNINLKINLKKKAEKRCNQNGFVSKIYKIVEKSNGVIDAENFNASANFVIKYSCKLCLPVENTLIVGKIRTINRVLMVIENGPILSVVLSSNTNTDNFKINNQNNLYHIKTNKELEIGDFVKIKILSKKFNFNDNQIKTMAYLEDTATDDEVSKYFSTVINDNEISLNEREEEDINSDDNFVDEQDSEDEEEDFEQDGGGSQNTGSNFII
jgi:DNA-directed RNA polymerase subunit E'/Rpb7